MKADNFDDQCAIVVALNRLLAMRVISDSNGFWLSFSFLYKLVATTGIIYCVFINCSFINMEQFNYVGSVMFVALMVVSCACNISMQILGWWYHKDFSLLRKNIAETDESLKRMNVAVNHRNVFVWTVTMSAIACMNALWIISYNAYLVYTRNITSSFMYSDIVYSTMLNIDGMVALDFMMHVCWLRNNFERTNDLLKKFFVEECQIGAEEWNNKLVSSWLQRCLNGWHVDRISDRNKIIPYTGTQIMKRRLYENKTSMLQRIRYVHLQLCTITRTLNRIFDKQIMFFSTLCTLNLVSYFYYCYAHYGEAGLMTTEGRILFITYFVDALLEWAKIVLISCLCEKTAKEAKQVAHIIHVCSIHNSDVELKNELIQFSLQVSLSEADRKDTHLFWLNDTFVIRSIGAVVTYLVVMIQLDETSN